MDLDLQEALAEARLLEYGYLPMAVKAENFPNMVQEMVEMEDLEEAEDGMDMVAEDINLVVEVEAAIQVPVGQEGLGEDLAGIKAVMVKME